MGCACRSYFKNAKSKTCVFVFLLGWFFFLYMFHVLNKNMPRTAFVTGKTLSKCIDTATLAHTESYSPYRVFYIHLLFILFDCKRIKDTVPKCAGSLAIKMSDG